MRYRQCKAKYNYVYLTSMGMKSRTGCMFFCMGNSLWALIMWANGHMGTLWLYMCSGFARLTKHTISGGSGYGVYYISYWGLNVYHIVYWVFYCIGYRGANITILLKKIAHSVLTHLTVLCKKSIIAYKLKYWTLKYTVYCCLDITGQYLLFSSHFKSDGSIFTKFV